LRSQTIIQHLDFKLFQLLTQQNSVSVSIEGKLQQRSVVATVGYLEDPAATGKTGSLVPPGAAHEFGGIPYSQKAAPPIVPSPT
jgi:hypothetical protein